MRLTVLASQVHSTIDLPLPATPRTNRGFPSKFKLAIRCWSRDSTGFIVFRSQNCLPKSNGAAAVVS